MRFGTPRRAQAVIEVGDLRGTDHVLDVGCGYGEVAVTVADCVEHVHGLDMRGKRVQGAAELAAARGISNASFEKATIEDYPFGPLAWDVTIFMRVWGQGVGAHKVGEAALTRVLGTTRRQAIIQAGKPRSEPKLRQVMEICDTSGFDAAWFVSRKLIVANRRGAYARIHALPERLLSSGPSGVELLPTDAAPDHPMIKSFDRRTKAA